VHAAQAGVPIVRLQKLLGHATPTMTMRYMKHAPEAYLDQDAAAIAARMAGAANPGGDARV
jgi:integrase